ncbi:hypothetical protein Tco_1132228, partial [Tanacetum coccineum]
MRSEVVVAVEWRLPWMVVMTVAHEDDGCGCRGDSGVSGWCVATTMVKMKRGGEMRRLLWRWLRCGGWSKFGRKLARNGGDGAGIFKEGREMCMCVWWQ